MKVRTLLHCSFCRKSEKQVRKLIAGGGGKDVYICDECTAAAAKIVEESKSS